jgi:hypothetical protein
MDLLNDAHDNDALAHYGAGSSSAVRLAMRGTARATTRFISLGRQHLARVLSHDSSFHRLCAGFDAFLANVKVERWGARQALKEMERFADTLRATRDTFPDEVSLGQAVAFWVAETATLRRLCDSMGASTNGGSCADFSRWFMSCVAPAEAVEAQSAARDKLCRAHFSSFSESGEGEKAVPRARRERARQSSHERGASSARSSGRHDDGRSRHDDGRQQGRSGSAPASGECARCRQRGHSAAACTNARVCNRCRKPGHMAADCRSN